MPFYDFKCRTCGSVSELLTPPTAEWRKCSCGGRSRRLFSGDFNALNTTSPNGERFKGLEVALGTRPTSVGEQAAIMAEQGCRPAEEYRYTKGGLERQEITEKELGEVLRETNNVGTI